MSENEPDGQQDGRSFSVRRFPDGMSIVSASGNVDGDKPSLLGRLVADELAREPAQLVLELSRATSVDSAFVEALAGASALAGESDTSFCLVVSPTGPVAKALAAAGLIERFEIFSTVGEARLLR
ncbi:STAS domain-containing protein [Mycobacterium sp. smrl_JER01]|uniref:STAS domain-containing protein n=1 Tax=Mycobacterium sp. smrl_JER01 TaxID=3402633 RepID=UPI003AD25D39